MKLKSVLVLVTILMTNILFAQDKNDVVLSIEGKDVSVGEFLAIYNKNNVEIESADKKSMEEYLELYLNFKLKVHDAEVQGYDTIPSFENELKGYVDQLSSPYLVDNQFTEDLIKQAYDRSKYEIRASHIMIKIPENPTPADTLKAWSKINEVLLAAKSADDFEALAIKFSEDPSVAKNKGDLGYFSVFRMVYPFENEAYETPIGSISSPIRTTYGYHVIKVMDKREARGEIKAAHIMIISNEKSTKEEAEKAKEKIAEIYHELEAGASFSKLANTYSDDRGSAQKGGDLGWFGAGRMVPIFEDNAFALKENGDFSEPFLSQFGWHIVLREDKRDIGTYEDEYEALSKKVKGDRRSLGSEHALVIKLMDDYNVKVKYKTVTPFYDLVDSSYFKNKWNADTAKYLTSVMITINDKTYGKKKVTYTQADFVEYLIQNSRGQKERTISMLIDQQFKGFIDFAIIDYEKTVLGLKYPEYKALVTEYHDGILLFEIMETEVWKKAMTDSIGLDAFYVAHQSDYMWEERLDAQIFICNSAEVADGVMKMLKDNQSDSTIVSVLNEESQLTVNYREGKFEKGTESYLKGASWKTGVYNTTIDQSVVVVNVIEVLAPVSKSLKEVRGLVTSAYQDELDERWVTELRNKYTYTINKEALYETK